MRIVLVTLCALMFYPVFSQEKKEDTIAVKKPFFKRIFHRVQNAITTSSTDSAAKKDVLKTKSKDPFVGFEGKTIRNIYTLELGFEKTLTDTSNRINYFGTKILNALHNKTKGWVIYDNLFIKEKTELNAYKLADNERYLRSLNFIQDARILVEPVPGDADSVDLLVVTKDLFSITGSVSANGFKRFKASAAETNLSGAGQGVRISTLFDKSRNPVFGYQLEYSKNSIAHSFIDATVGYTLINTGNMGGKEDETSFYLKLDRPLVSPYSKLAGGFEVSFNSSENLFGKPDSLFYNYRYNLYDGWVGLNIGTGRILASKNQYRNRHFIAVRYFHDHFAETPFQIGNNFDPFYNSRQALLSEFTFFRQEFNKTNYIYGFGTTEDVPYGYNISVTGGWYKQLNLERPYFGFNANRYIFTNRGEFMQFFLRSGTFINSKKWEDASVLLGANLYSRLYVYNNFKLREHLKFSYTRQFNRLTSEALRIDNPLGLQYFSSDSTFGSQRLSLYAETYLISKYKLFGFQFSPFVFGDFTLLTPESARFSKSNIYTGFGGGMRTRNENLVFGTIELRMMYFPRRATDMNPFKISLRSNIRFRYNSRYIKAPDVIQLNNDEANNVY